jgi:thiamine biosynthesis lipoprotein
MKRRAQPWLGTLVDISIADPIDDTHSAAAFEAAFERIAAIHHRMGFHDPASDVSRINRAAVGEAVPVAADTRHVLVTAALLTEASASIFNIGCATQLMAWELLPKAHSTQPYLPGDCGLEIAPDGSVTKTRPLVIDLGGIAKGYAVDQAIEALQQAGIASACVNAGGDLRVLGDTPFAIAVRDPGAITTARASVEVANAALATSACYFSRRRIGPDSISALVDGRSGAAIDNALSVSVSAPTCMLADALTKIVMATGDAAHPLLARFGAQAFIL